MTATPIPRTLALTAYGDMDMSRLTEKPAGRKPIATRAIPLTRLEEVIDAIDRAVDKGERVFWVCPLVEENEDLDLTAAEERYDALKRDVRRSRASDPRPHEGRRERPSDRRLPQRGKAQILVATTVIEVGVDVPDATIIVIEHAERFGLAQLHQLRGRVGRGAQAVDVPAALPGAARRDSARAPRLPAQRPTTASSSPRRTCACAAPANSWASASPACRLSASPT